MKTILFLLSIIIFIPSCFGLANGIKRSQSLNPISITVGNINQGITDSEESTAVIIKIIGLLTVLALAPSILIMMTSFVRIVIVLSFLRQAIGTQSLPPNQLLIGLALFLTAFVMAPVWKDIQINAIEPYFEKKIIQSEALKRAEKSIRWFMFNQTREKDLGLFIKLGKADEIKKRADVPTYLLIPAFVISELKTAFQIGFLIYIPFLVLDMIVASILMGMGMMMVPPVVIALPFKLILFVLVDGWQLIVGSLVKSFG